MTHSKLAKRLKKKGDRIEKRYGKRSKRYRRFESKLRGLLR